MNPYFRYFAFIGVALVLGIAIYFTGQIKPDPSKIFMGVGGDPRMRLCDGPANGELAHPDILAKLKIATPLVRNERDKAAYRVSVLRPLGQESLSVTMITPKDSPGKITVARWTGGALTEAKVDLDLIDASALILAFQQAKIWDEVKPTVETLARTGEASSVIEVRAPGYDRCVTTRYDDEHVRGLLATFVRRVGPLVAPLKLEAMQAPEAGFMSGGPQSAPGQGR
jgi:hypothetical protein